MKAAAQVSIFGMDPWEFLTTRDPFKRNTMLAVVAAASALEEEHDLRRANKIAAEVSRIFKKK